MEESGLFIINLLTHSEEDYALVVENLKECFNIIYQAKCPTEVNCIIFCSNDDEAVD